MFSLFDSTRSVNGSLPTEMIRPLIEDLSFLARLLSSFLPPELHCSYQWTAPPPSPSDNSSPMPALPPQFDWNDLESAEDTGFQDSLEKQGLALLAQGLLDFLAQDPDDIESDEEWEERSEMGDDGHISEPEAADAGEFSWG